MKTAADMMGGAGGGTVSAKDVSQQEGDPHVQQAIDTMLMQVRRWSMEPAEQVSPPSFWDGKQVEETTPNSIQHDFRRGRRLVSCRFII